MTADRAFGAVVKACANVSRPGQAGTWITDDMCAAYESLHASGVAHSIEAWHNDHLVGGLYGISLGQMFFGESMFAHARDASKCAFAILCAQLAAWQFKLIDCQMMNDHLASLGVVQISRADFMHQLEHNNLSLTRDGVWQLDCLEAWQ
jgi:leucyl/phenylalanyl-tRNA--protein transferase